MTQVMLDTNATLNEKYNIIIVLLGPIGTTYTLFTLNVKCS